MKITVSLRLKGKISPDLKRKLVGHGFQFFLRNRIENEYKPIEGDEVNSVTLDENSELVFIYNGYDLSEFEIESLYKLVARIQKAKSFMESNIRTAKE